VIIHSWVEIWFEKGDVIKNAGGDQGEVKSKGALNYLHIAKAGRAILNIRKTRNN